MDMMEGIFNEELGPEDLLELIESPEYLSYIPFPLVEVDTGDVASVMVGAMVDDAEDVEQDFWYHYLVSWQSESTDF